MSIQLLTAASCLGLVVMTCPGPRWASALCGVSQVSRRTAVALLSVWLAGSAAAQGLPAGKPEILTASDLGHLATASPGRHIAYGVDPLQFGELHMPNGEGPFPVVVYFHGGCWLAEFGDLTNSRPIAHALSALGTAVWSVEYRRLGNDGSGWPHTFRDAATGTDYLRELAIDYPIDLARVITMGHSVGGHLALWIAARGRFPKTAEFHTKKPLPIAGVVGLAPVPEPRMMYEQRNCGNSVAKLLGGSPNELPDRYAEAAPSTFSPIGVPQYLILGKFDDTWVANGRAYTEIARAAGDAQITLVVAPESGHFEMMDPGSSTWPLVRAAVRAVAGLEQ